MTRALLVAALGLALWAAPAAAQTASDFTDWTSARTTSPTSTPRGSSTFYAQGVLHGFGVTLQGPDISDTSSGSVTNGSATDFADASKFTPPLPTSDRIAFFARNNFPFSYTLTFASAVTDPVLHIANLGTTLTFSSGTQITRVSGQSGFSVSGTTVSGVPEGSVDRSGTVRISGTVTSLTFTTQGDQGFDDQIYLQVGAAAPSGGGGGGGGGGGATPSGPPPGIVATVTGDTKIGSLASGKSFKTVFTSIAGSKGDASIRYDFGGDGKTDVSCNGTQSQLTAQVVNGGPSLVKVSAVDAFGQASKTLTVNFTATKQPTLGTIKKFPTFHYASQPVYTCSRAPEDPVVPIADGGTNPPPATCGKTIFFGLIEATGCLDEWNLTGAPFDETQSVGAEAFLGGKLNVYRGPNPQSKFIRTIGKHHLTARAAQSPLDIINWINQILSVVQKVQEQQPSYVSTKPVRINGLDFVPRNGKSIHLWPRIEQVTSDDAVVKLGAITLLQGKISLDVDPKHHDSIPLGSFDPSKFIPIAGFPEVGQVSASLVSGATRATLRVKLPEPLSLPGEPITGQLSALATNRHSLQLDDSYIVVPHAFIGPLEVKDLSVRYTRSDDSWRGSFFMSFYPGGPSITAKPPPREYGINFQHGGFQSAGASFAFGDLRPQIFPGVFLDEVGVGFGLHPIVLRGTARISALDRVKVGGDVLFVLASPKESYTIRDGGRSGGLTPLLGTRLTGTAIALGGTVSLEPLPVVKRISLGNGFAVYQVDPLYIHAGGGTSVDLLGIGVIEGTFDGEISSKGFSYSGHTFIGIKVPTWARPLLGSRVGWHGDGIISSAGIGGCTVIPHIGADFGFFSVDAGGRVGIGWRYHGTPDIFLADNCDIGRYRVMVRPSQVHRSAVHTFHVAKGQRALNVRLDGSGGEPRVDVKGPNGETFTSAEHHILKDKMMLWEIGDSGRTYFAVRDPSPGTWTVTEEAGSPPITSVATADALPPARVAARVTGRGAHRVLHYRLRDRPGQTVTFVEQGRQSFQQLGNAKSTSGVIRFTPADGPAATHTIVARISLDGVPRENLTVARFRYAGPVAPAAPRVRVSHRGSRVSLRWNRVSGVRRWSVTVTERSGLKHSLSLRTSARRASVKVPATQSGTVTVRGIGALNIVGPAGRGRFKATRKETTNFRVPFNVPALRRAARRAS